MPPSPRRRGTTRPLATRRPASRSDRAWPNMSVEQQFMWPCCIDFEAAYESAVLAGNENPGGDPAVITDTAIGSAVQAALARRGHAVTAQLIGDLDPEDAYDAGDPPDLRIAVLRRVAEDLRDNPADDGRRNFRRLDALRLVEVLDQLVLTPDQGDRARRRAGDPRGPRLMGRWATDLADVCRRTRLPGDRGRRMAVAISWWRRRCVDRRLRGRRTESHHRSPHRQQPRQRRVVDVNYMVHKLATPAPPCGNLCTPAGCRGPSPWPAARPTRTAAGEDPCGLVAGDNMSAKSIAIEAANNGVGEPWPAAQQNAYVALVAELGAAYGIARQVHHHSVGTRPEDRPRRRRALRRRRRHGGNDRLPRRRRGRHDTARAAGTAGAGPNRKATRHERLCSGVRRGPAPRGRRL